MSGVQGRAGEHKHVSSRIVAGDVATFGHLMLLTCIGTKAGASGGGRMRSGHGVLEGVRKTLAWGSERTYMQEGRGHGGGQGGDPARGWPGNK